MGAGAYDLPHFSFNLASVIGKEVKQQVPAGKNIIDHFHSV